MNDSPTPSPEIAEQPMPSVAPWLSEVFRRNGPCPTCGTLGMVGSIEDATPKPADPTSVAGERMREAVERAAHALHELEESWNDIAWEYLTDNMRKIFREQAAVAVYAALATNAPDAAKREGL